MKYRFSSYQWPLFLVLLAPCLHKQSFTSTNASPDYHYDVSRWMNHRDFDVSEQPQGRSHANFDGKGTYFIAEKKHSSIISVGTIQFATRIGHDVDSILLDESPTTLPLSLSSAATVVDTLGGLYLLASAWQGPLATANVIVHYNDSTSSQTEIHLPDWKVRNLHQIRTLARSWPLSDGTSGALFAIPVYVDPSKSATSITLPQLTYGHVFAMTGLLSGQETIHPVRLIQAQSHGFVDENKTALRIHLQNTSPQWLDRIVVTAGGEGSQHVVVDNLPPGQLRMTQVVVPFSHYQDNSSINVAATGAVSVRFHVDVGSPRSLDRHHAPQWLEEAKFGIFIHWGVFSVPAWAPVGKEYAEWYWWQMNHPNDPTYAYHKATYGENVTYDSFVHSSALGSNFSAKAWLDLIEQARARYFVFTTKHHDGFAMWDTRVSDRSLAKLGPKRDVVHELMSLARQSYPHIKRGVYFSLPEWYHPQYNDSSLNWHGPPFDPYITNRTLAYTGDLGTVIDFVNDLQVPQALELIHTFAPDLFWCDIGGINNSTVWQTVFLEAATAASRPVSWNDRCGSGSASDFTTVEYKTEAIPPDRFWEATRGVDPYSFGYNQATQASQYATPTELVHQLITTVSRGGNFLLNVGPDATGIVREPMVSTLQAIGAWIGIHTDAIFNTTFYWVAPTGATSKEGVRLCFTVAEHAVYIFALDQPSHTLTLDVPLPVRRRVTSKLARGPGTTEAEEVVDVPWSINPTTGQLTLAVPDVVRTQETYCWVFRIE